MRVGFVSPKPKPSRGLTKDDIQNMDVGTIIKFVFDLKGVVIADMDGPLNRRILLLNGDCEFEMAAVDGAFSEDSLRQAKVIGRVKNMTIEMEDID